MEILDTSIANVALPHIAGNLGAGVEDSTWILTSYLVSNAIVLPISGWMSTLFGRRNFYLACVALFTLSSLLCGLAPNLSVLVLCRLLQGLGGGGLQPSTQAILVDTFPLAKRGMGMAVYGMTVVAAPVIGPTLGGWITDNASWRWVFFINVPIGVLSLLLSSRFITDPPFLPRRHGAERSSIDWMGLGGLALAIGALQMILDLGERYDWMASRFICTLAVASVTAFVFTIWWELRHEDPVVDLRLLGERNFALSVAATLLFGFVLYGSTVLIPLFTQTLMGYTAMLSGMAVSPSGLVIMFFMPIVGWLVAHLDARKMIIFGALVVSSALFAMGRFSLDVAFGDIVVARMLQGLGMAFIFVPLSTVSYAFIRTADRGAASSLISLARNIGASVGIASMATMIARQAQVHQSLLVAHATPLDPAYGAWMTQLTAAFSAHTSDLAQATAQAQAAIYQMLGAQARTLAFVDVFRMMSIGFLIVVPMMLLIRKPPSTAGAAAVVLE
ncbi:MAG: DHA2 family efflux MFS transporter permease subunit [Deltaproteobacteria bacterium]|nr:DHA2 family efflux MFS transporter permease subunit [Deltaproteobacteria bacterium]